MVLTKSLDELKLIVATLHDLHKNHGAVFNKRALRLTSKKLEKRYATEGIGFLTKTLPRLGKAFDKALTGVAPLNAADLRLASQVGSRLPKLFGEFFNRVLNQDGTVLQEPDPTSVGVIRQLCYLFYKYKLPFTDEQEREVISRFVKTEEDLSTSDRRLDFLYAMVGETTDDSVPYTSEPVIRNQLSVIREARRLLRNLFLYFDPKDIYPKHGPGAVATKQQLWSKYLWTNVSANITRTYPLDEYFYSSCGHVCDELESFKGLEQEDLPARVLLVPKDSRGPRLISCEPVDYQWIQQGLGKAIVDHVEQHYLTKYNVFFTDQGPNQRGALLGSLNGRYATLDLNEASDRVSLGLVRLLFPPRIYECLESCRSSSTVLPDGRILKLRKFAPMGSALCFPILALTIWAILTAVAATEDASYKVRKDFRESILVYGDDVIVPSAFAREAMEQLESFGLKINRDKSCTSGFFRESCGTDAFKGVNVTPVRFRTVWSSRQSADVYASYIAYANSLYEKQYLTTYYMIVGELERIYGPIPTKDLLLNTDLSLHKAPLSHTLKTRYNKALQKREYRIWDTKCKVINKEINGWSMLLRYFTERVGRPQVPVDNMPTPTFLNVGDRFSVRSYTPRRTSMLVRRWR